HDPRSAQHEQEGSDEHVLQSLGMSRKAQARPDGTEQVFGGESGGLGSLSPPREKHPDDPEKRQGVEHEYDAWSSHRYDESSEGGTQRSSDVDADTAQRDSRLEFLFRQEFGDDRVPRGVVDSSCDAESEGEREQHPWRHGACKRQDCK